MILVLLIISLVLRLVGLNQSLWLDESVQAITAQGSFGYIFQEIAGDFHPPFFHFLMHFWVRVFGSSEIALRIPSVLFGVGTVFIVYKLSPMVGLKGWSRLIAPLFLATAPFHIYYSQEARMYSLVTFLAAGSIYFFAKALDEHLSVPSRRKFVFLFFLFSLLAVYSDYYAWAVVLLQAAYVIFKRKSFFVPAFLLLIVLYIPWLPMLAVQVKTGLLATQNLPGWGRLVNLSFLKALPLTFVKFSIGRITIFNKTLYGLAAGVIGVFYGILMVGGIKKSFKEKEKNNLVVLWGWFFVPLLLSWFVSFFVPNFQPFRLLLIIPAFYLLLSLGISFIKNINYRILAIFLVLLINFISLFAYWRTPFFQREDWRGLVVFLKSQTGLVVLPSETSAWPIKYYDPENKLRVVYGGTGVAEIESAKQLGEPLAREDKIYYIRYLVPLFDEREQILAELDLEGYTKVEEISFNQIPLWGFEKN